MDGPLLHVTELRFDNWQLTERIHNNLFKTDRHLFSFIIFRGVPPPNDAFPIMHFPPISDSPSFQNISESAKIFHTLSPKSRPMFHPLKFLMTYSFFHSFTHFENL